MCAAAIDIAREAAAQDAGDPGLIGEHLGVEAEGERLALHRFASTAPAYRGWHWAVVVSRAARAKVATVAEVTLLPGGDALLAPGWLPWSERVRPGDVGAGDLLPTAADDPRLDLRVGDVFELSDDRLFTELGLGRARVLSLEGREVAAERWYDGPAGPDTPVAKVAPARCSSCGFLVHLVGALGQVFGVCANEMSPEDGTVVATDHGCGAHSEALVMPGAEPERFTPEVTEDPEPGVVAFTADAPEDGATEHGATDATDDRPSLVPSTGAPAVHGVPSVDDAEGSVTGTEGGEPYGHS